MKFIFIFVLMNFSFNNQNSNVKKDYIMNCQNCHSSADKFFTGKLKTKDLYGTIKDMYLYQVGVKPSEKSLKDMYNYARSFKK